MIYYRHADPRFPFLWESPVQPAARWHDESGGPVQYLADTPDGAWAELLRREAIVSEEDLGGLERDLWAIDVPESEIPSTTPGLALQILVGGLASYPACRTEARRLQAAGARGFVTPSAAVLEGEANGWRVRQGVLEEGPPRDGNVLVLFGPRPQLVGWCAASAGRPSPRVLSKVRHLTDGVQI